MTKIWSEQGFVENDPWIIETDDVKAGEGQNAVLSLDAFLTRAAESNDVGLGVLIPPADDVTKLAPFIDRIALIAVSFPAFNDGRGFSHASLLRTRLNYQGELRAVGDVLIDSFAVTNETAIRRLSENRLPGIDVYYQPTAKPAAEGETYSWRRRAAV